MRIAEKPWWQYRWYLRPFFWNQRRKYGQVLHSALLWGRSPRVFLGVALLYGALGRWRDSSVFSEREQAALGYAEVMTRGEFPVSEELMRRLHGCFDDDAIVELTALIAFQNL